MQRAQEIAARHYEIPGSQRIAVSVDSLLHWARRYRQGGFEPWLPNLGRIVEPFRAITPQLAELIERLKLENPYRTGTTLLRELALGSGSDSCSLAPATLYRFFKQRRVSARQMLAAPAHEKFQAEFSNQTWQSDILFGPYVQSVCR